MRWTAKSAPLTSSFFAAPADGVIVSPRTILRSYAGRAALLIAVCTLALTATFVGAVAVVTGAVESATSRAPYYLLAAALAFVGAVFAFSGDDAGARTVLFGAVGVALACFAVVALGGEGVVWAVSEPSAVFGSQLIVYLVSAALIGTGLTVWLLNYWRELTVADDEAL